MKVVLWDFDGTLASRDGMWSGCVMEVLEEDGPGHGLTADLVKRGLHDGFPWHVPHAPHPELCDPERWWEATEALIARTVAAGGIPDARARELARRVRLRYVDGTRGWRVFADVPASLARLRARGWRHVVLSNHVPELPALVEQLGLGDHFDAVLTSASTGFEKPHPEAFRQALAAADNPDRVWMVGDSVSADVRGANAVGVPAILVRVDDPQVTPRARDLEEAAELILAEDR